MRRDLALPMLATVVAVALAVPVSASVPAAPVREGRRVARVLAPSDAASLPDSQLAESVEGQRYPWLFERTDKDRLDERTGRQIHVVYVIAAGMPDDRFDELGMIEDSVRSMNVWTKQQTTDLQWIFDTHTFQWDDPATPETDPISVEAVDVTTILSSRSSDSLNSAGEVEAELARHGLADPNKRYLSYVASNAGGVCGDAFYPILPATGPVDGQFSQIYLYSSAGCRARDFAPNATQPYFTETIAMQEMIHNDAQVALSAPHDCVVSPLAFAHVCTGVLWASPSLDPESTDVMFPYVGLPLNQKFLDADHLDYFRHPFPHRDLEDGLYLESVS